jgi:hypothetical protein
LKIIIAKTTREIYPRTPEKLEIAIVPAFVAGEI